MIHNRSKGKRTQRELIPQLAVVQQAGNPNQTPHQGQWL